MYILVGTKAKEKKELWAGNSVCPYCGQQSDYFIHRIITQISVYFIPCLSITSGRILRCESCGYTKELKSKEYKAMQKKQLEMLENGTYPREKVSSDCSPKSIGLAWATVKLIFWGLFFSFLVLTVFFSLDGGVEPALLMSVIPFYILLGLPFYFSLRRYLVLLKMRKAYNKHINN